MKKDTGKIETNKLLKNGIKGFILAVVPIIIIDLETIISEKFYSFDFVSNIIGDVIKYGFLGLIVSIIYTYSAKRYPKISKYAALIIIVIYYLIALVFLILGIYFDRIGPLFG